MRGQMKLGESIIILVIFFFLLIFGLVYYIKFVFISYDKESVKRAQLLAIQSAQKVQFLPELQCTIEGNVRYNCMDAMKLNTFKNLPQEKKQIYAMLFPQTRVTVQQVYPSQVEWHIHGEEDEKADIEKFQIPVALFNATSDRYNLGYIEVDVYSKHVE